MLHGFLRVCCISPEVTVADCFSNAENIIHCIRTAMTEKASVAVFPELSITGYTCGDLFLQQTLQQTAIEALLHIAEATKTENLISIVGLPFACGNALYNCAAILFRGNILALIPKSFIPNYGEFYERRHFAPASTLGEKVKRVYISEKFPNVPLGTDILITNTKYVPFVLGIEICEDLWVPQPPSGRHTIAGATIVANLSASNEVIGKAAYRRLLVAAQSAHTCSAYLYSNAGHGESTTDMIFASHNLIAENGKLLAESKLFSEQITFADIDLERLIQERRRITTYIETPGSDSSYCIVPIDFELPDIEPQNLNRMVNPYPFVPSDRKERAERCREVVSLQAEGLAKRLRHTKISSTVIGLSGGLDSTLALLVTARAFDLCSISRKGIHAVTMPCFGTTDRTYRNACQLAEKIGATFSEIPIEKAVRQHFSDIGQDEKIHDVTYENCQARERTQILMDIANKTNGLVIGTGDLSELALGWATYNGDHMSMYGVNSSIPKTLVRYLVSWFADEAEETDKNLANVLRDILDTPVSPELLPPEQGQISQKTEEIVGPYDLHDFFLYYVLRFGFSPSKILYLAQKAFNMQNTDEMLKPCRYPKETILKWLQSFYKRFFSQQFKRSCMPDGAKVGTINLSPRGDWRMPSDACAAVWLSEIEKLENK